MMREKGKVLRKLFFSTLYLSAFTNVSRAVILERR